MEQKQEFDVELEQLIPQEKEGVMEIVTSWMEEGMEKGERKLVLRQLHRRFGDLGPATVKEIETLPTDRLEDLGEDLLGFSGRGDLDTWLQLHRS
jgi:hypothetical protein